MKIAAEETDLRPRIGRSLCFRNPWSRSALQRLGIMHDQEEVAEFERIRRLRNNLVHGIEVPDPADLRDTGAILQRLSGRLQQGSDAEH